MQLARPFLSPVLDFVLLFTQQMFESPLVVIQEVAGYPKVFCILIGDLSQSFTVEVNDRGAWVGE
jgi:hypothetical protein